MTTSPLPTSEPDDDPEDVDEQDETSRRVSFFEASNVDVPLRDHVSWDAIEAADEAVCSRIWEVFARHSTGNGFDARSLRSIRASKSLADRRAAGDPTAGGLLLRRATTVDIQGRTEAKMVRAKGADGLTDRQRAVRDAWHDLTIEGRPFNNGDVARRAGIQGGSPESRSANVATVMKRLRELRLFDAKPAKVATAPRANGAPRPGASARSTAPAPAPAPQPAITAPPPKPAPAMPEDPVLTELLARRAALAEKIARLDTAIEALRAAS